MFPNRENKTMELIKEYKKLFPEDFIKSYPFKLYGYVLVDKINNCIWGTPDGIAFYLIQSKEEAEAVKRAVDFDGRWEVKLFGLSELDMNVWVSEKDLKKEKYESENSQ